MKKKVENMNNIILKAAKFASKAHLGQFRKYHTPKIPYIIHPGRVAARVSIHPIATPQMVAAAWLHDVVEDTPITLEEIEEHFGLAVCLYVEELTNPSLNSTLLRAERKRMDREALAIASPAAKIIKLCDRIDNLYDLPRSPRDCDNWRSMCKFLKKKFIEESRLLLDAIGDVDDILSLELSEKIKEVTNYYGNCNY
jgi:(p)ppGpp synthase/HD superfamily hydrolase